MTTTAGRRPALPPCDGDGRYIFQDLWEWFDVKTGNDVMNHHNGDRYNDNSPSVMDNDDNDASDQDNGQKTSSGTTTSADDDDDDNLSVFVRIRPLLDTEIARGETRLEALAAVSETVLEPRACTAYRSSGGCSIGGFDGVLDPTASNRQVFDATLPSKLTGVVEWGRTVNLFCYGYTGSGKTHTMLGYGNETGLLELSASHLLDLIRVRNEKNKTRKTRIISQQDGKDNNNNDDDYRHCNDDNDDDNDSSSEQLFLVATVCELYQDKAHDILDPCRAECTLREDADGQLRILGPPKSFSLSEILDAEKKRQRQEQQQRGEDDDNEEEQPSSPPPLDLSTEGPHATIVVQRRGLTPRIIRTADDLKGLVRSSCAARTVGSSTEHDASSRSHCVVELRVAHHKLQSAQSELRAAESKLPALLNALDNSGTAFWSQLVDQKSADAKGTFKLKEYPDDADEWWNRLDALRARQVPIYRAALQTLRDVDDARQQVRALENKAAGGGVVTGGKLVLVDLAGADYDHRSCGNSASMTVARKESIAINKSLLSLKECLRALNVSNCKSSSARKAPFRGSKLTRVLREALQPSSSTSKSVMMINVGPASGMERKTINTLRYGQLFHQSSSSSSSSSTSAGKTKSTVSSNNAAAAATATAARQSTTSKPWLQQHRNKVGKERAGTKDPVSIEIVS